MKLLLILLISLSLYGTGFWTLTGVDKANLYISNQVSPLKPDTLQNIRNKMTQSLHSNSIATDKQDSPTLSVYLEELVEEDTHYVYVRLALSEEVQTFRTNKDHTYAITYSVSDFIEVDVEELDNDILESVDFLLSQFSEQYEDDKE